MSNFSDFATAVGVDVKEIKKLVRDDNQNMPYQFGYVYTGLNNIIYDKKAKTIFFPKTNVKSGMANNWTAGPVTIPLAGNAGFILYDKATNQIIKGDVPKEGQTALGFYEHRRGQIYLATRNILEKTKNIACLGDSITEGVNANGKPWHYYIDAWCKNNGINSVITNLGIGGTLVSDGVGNTAQAFVRRLNTIPSDADIVTVFGGTNDWSNHATLGTISDTDTKTFYGAYKRILEWLQINRPNAQIITITPLKRYYRGSGTVWKNAQTETNNKGNLLQDFVQAVKEVSALYAVPCVDLHNESGINPVLSQHRTAFIGDGLHPTDKGNLKMYPIILDKMRPYLDFDSQMLP